MSTVTIKLGVAGTHSTGKSTFLEGLEKGLTPLGLKVTTVKSLATAARDAGFPILQDQTIETALWIMSEGIRLETEASLSSDVVLVDRAIFDAIGYLKAALAISNREFDTARLHMLENIAHSYAREYDFLVLTELDETIPLGDRRNPNVNFRVLAGEKILDFAQAKKLNFVQMTYHNRQSVAHEGLEFVRNKLNIT